MKLLLLFCYCARAVSKDSWKGISYYKRCIISRVAACINLHHHSGLCIKRIINIISFSPCIVSYLVNFCNQTKWNRILVLRSFNKTPPSAIPSPISLATIIPFIILVLLNNTLYLSTSSWIVLEIMTDRPTDQHTDMRIHSYMSNKNKSQKKLLLYKMQ